MLNDLIYSISKVRVSHKLAEDARQAEDAVFAAALTYMAKPPFIGRQPIPSSPFVDNLSDDVLLRWLEAELTELGKVRKDSSNFIFNFLSELADVVPLALEMRARRLQPSKATSEALHGLVSLGMSPGLGRLFFRVSDLKSEARTLIDTERR